MEQIEGYLAGLGLDWGWLVIFDGQSPVGDHRRSGLPDIEERTTTEAATTGSDRRITVIRD